MELQEPHYLYEQGIAEHIASKQQVICSNCEEVFMKNDRLSIEMSRKLGLKGRWCPHCGEENEG